MKKIVLLLMIIFFFFCGINIKAYNFGINKTYDGTRPYPGKEIHDLIVNNNGLYLGPDDKTLYMTFDCGYENGYTKSMLEVLKEENVKAIFFITGHYLCSSKEIVKQMIDDGHVIGNHSYNHKNFSKISGNEMLEDLSKLEMKFKEEFNTEISNFVRPPEGTISKNNQEILKEKGYKTLYWSLAYVDWYKDKYYQNHYSYNNVIPRLHNGAIILMHTVGKDNMVDLKDIIVGIREKGYKIGSPLDLK